jgi:hypothetical protein
MGKKSNLRPFVEGVIGTGLSDDEAYAFDLEDLLGRACPLNVVHAEVGDNIYANIHSASPTAVRRSSAVFCPLSFGLVDEHQWLSV